MKCNVKYKGQIYKVRLKDKLSIILIKVILCIKRNYRKIRSLIPENISLYLLLTFVWAIYALSNIILYKYMDNKKNIVDIILELKNSYFSSVILAFIMTSYNENYRHKEKLLQQHVFYVDTMDRFENLFTVFLGDEINQYMIFYTEQTLDDTFEYIEELYNQKLDNFLHSDKFKDSLKKLIKHLNEEKKLKIRQHYINIDNQKLESLFDSLTDLDGYLDENVKDCQFLLQQLHEIALAMMEIINDLRVPWRKDIKNDIRILKILEKNNAKYITSDFYFNMILHGHSFK